jgi:hypothetical protein
VDSSRDERPKFKFTNATIAALSGLVLLLLAHVGSDETEFVRAVIREIGFALIVAVIIWFCFEVFSQYDSDEHWNNRIELITKNVFFGVFRRNFPPEFIREANILVLEHTFIRSATNVTYTLEDVFYTNRFGKNQTFVKLSSILRFKQKNISNTSKPCELKIGLPNPIVDELKQFCRVVKVKINGYHDRSQAEMDSYLEKHIENENRDLQERLKNDDLSMIPLHVIDLTLKPNEEIEIVYEYTMAKEEEDTEICQTLYPTESINITIVDKGPTRRIVRARSIHHADLDNDSSASGSGTYNFRLDRYLLPHQGYAVWWKKVPAPPT